MTMRIFNIGRANAILAAADDILNPALEKAGVKEIKLGDKAVPLAEAPLPDRLATLLAVTRPGEGQHDMNELLCTNDTLAKQCEQFREELTVARATVEALQREKKDLEAKLVSTEAALKEVTAGRDRLQVELKAASDTAVRLQAEANAINEKVTTMCLDAAVLQLPDQPPEQRRAAALAVPVADKLQAYTGAVHAALARLGAPPGRAPNAGPSPGPVAVGHAAILEELASKRGPDWIAFYRKHKAAIDAAVAAQKKQQ